MTGKEITNIFVDGKYALIKLLGKGSFGEIYTAKHIVTNKSVAIKLVLYFNRVGVEEYKAQHFTSRSKSL